MKRDDLARFGIGGNKRQGPSRACCTTCGQGNYPVGATVLFVITGGVPGLFAYPDVLAG